MPGHDHPLVPGGGVPWCELRACRDAGFRSAIGLRSGICRLLWSPNRALLVSDGLRKRGCRKTQAEAKAKAAARSPSGALRLISGSLEQTLAVAADSLTDEDAALVRTLWGTAVELAACTGNRTMAEYRHLLDDLHSRKRQRLAARSSVDRLCCPLFMAA